MKKKLLKKLVIASYDTKSKLNEERVESIATHLNRVELKEYIRALRNFEKGKRLVVDSSFAPTLAQEEMLKEKFPDKEIVFHLNPELLFGVRITDNDIVYDMNLRRTLDAIEDYIEQQYD